MHVLQLDWPVAVWYSPAGHVVQLEAPALLYVPALQGDCAVEVQEFPAVHSVHEEAPADEYHPEKQSKMLSML